MLKLFKIKTIAEAKELKANGQDLSTDFEKGYLKFQVDSMDLDHGVAKRSGQEGTPDREAAARSKAVAQNGNGHNGTKIMATWAKRIAWAPITIGKCWKSRNHPYTSLYSHEISWIVNVSVSGQEDAQSVQWYPQQVSTVLFPFPVCTQKTFCFLPNSVLWRILLRWLEHVYEYVICDQHWPTTLRSLGAQKTVITHILNQFHTCSTSIPSAGFPRLPGTSWRTFEQLACHKRRRLFCSTCWQCHCYCNSTISKSGTFHTGPFLLSCLAFARIAAPRYLGVCVCALCQRRMISGMFLSVLLMLSAPECQALNIPRLQRMLPGGISRYFVRQAVLNH